MWKMRAVEFNSISDDLKKNPIYSSFAVYYNKQK